MRLVVSLFFGAFGGLVLFVDALMIYMADDNTLWGYLGVVAGVLAWVGCTTIMCKGAKRLSHVMMRGSLIGVWLWLSFFFAGVVCAWLLDGENVMNSEGVVTSITGERIVSKSAVVSAVMVVACFVVYALFSLVERQRQIEEKAG